MEYKLYRLLLLSMGLNLECGWHVQCHFNEEDDFSFSGSYYLQLASWLGVKLGVPLLYSVFGIWSSLSMLSQFLWTHVLISPVVSRKCFLEVIHYLWIYDILHFIHIFSAYAYEHMCVDTHNLLWDNDLVRSQETQRHKL